LPPGVITKAAGMVTPLLTLGVGRAFF